MVALSLLFQTTHRNQTQENIEMRKNTWLIAAFCLVVVILLISGLWKLFFESKSTVVSVHKQPSTKALSGIALVQLQPEDFIPASIYDGKNLVILFSPTDCGICLEMLFTLNEIYVKGANRLPIIGIIDTPYLPAASKVQKHFKLQFPLVMDSTGTLKKQLGKQSKPILFLVDNGDVGNQAIIGDPKDLPRVRQLLKVLR